MIDTPIAQLEADSIPEGVAQPTVPEADPFRPTLDVVDQARTFRILSTSRLLRTPAPSAFQGDIRSGNRPLDSGKTLYTVALDVPSPLTEQELDFFRRRLEENSVWRAKGFVTMTDGRIKKIDYVFGDFYIANKSPAAPAVPDKVVLIGEDRRALSEEGLVERFFGKPANKVKG